MIKTFTTPEQTQLLFDKYLEKPQSVEVFDDENGKKQHRPAYSLDELIKLGTHDLAQRVTWTNSDFSYNVTLKIESPERDPDSSYYGCYYTEFEAEGTPRQVIDKLVEWKIGKDKVTSCSPCSSLW